MTIWVNRLWGEKNKQGPQTTLFGRFKHREFKLQHSFFFLYFFYYYQPFQKPKTKDGTNTITDWPNNICIRLQPSTACIHTSHHKSTSTSISLPYHPTKAMSRGLGLRQAEASRTRLANWAPLTTPITQDTEWVELPLLVGCSCKWKHPNMTRLW